MSILINMEMPKNCGDCKAFVCYRQWAGDVGDCFCGITKNDAKAKEKNADCPLVPVPPHGRLIDAGSFIKSVKSIEAEPDYQHDGEDRRVGLIIAEPLAYEQPTVIPAEEGE